ncbi:hypothetical protein B1748_15630 [Paenibacillus sp. MY03]|uniref:DUF2264 domain-containing protein n=1 Tax=Paenibacillus sp. MY03 TaxID=302980 RepID=UPI000B3C6D61|nr:DUF2264 domain-containing protein [Paenibacillus sp. MY03]OUS75856.1 hypothetical protein B1748_15630 [Paenibacillus sp. MY03]
MFMNNPVSHNPLTTKADLREAFIQLSQPLKGLYSEGGARLQIRGAGAGHTEEVADLESFSRIWWGLVPHLVGGGEKTEIAEMNLKGIINGTDPDHPEYWGEVSDYDQRLVEMAAMGLALCLAPQHFWEPLGERERGNLYQWLNQINLHPCHDCNWLFFQVMVNLGFRGIGRPYDSEQVERNLRRIDEFYLDNGWYSDGVNGHSDYYVPFAFHYYGLIYSKLMEKEDPDRCARYKERGLKFAHQFLHWFSSDGAALPYGRSLAYRFAQSAFWSAFAYAGLESKVLTPGVVKGLLLRNLRWWFKQPIFDSAGILTVGYAYPNLIMAENYNAPGSPYWALKSLLVLALPDDSVFWTAEEMAFPSEAPSITIQPEPHFVVCRDQETGHVAAFNSGHLFSNEHTHTSAKYEKFAYSTSFGFCVPRAEWGITQSAPDSMLALSEGDNLYRVRRKNEETWIRGHVLYAKWRPWHDVEVETWLVSGSPWHMRIHRIHTGRELHAAEGGFALGFHKELNRSEHETGIYASNRYGTSGAQGLMGYASAQLAYLNANSNVLHPRTVLPVLQAQLGPGSHLLAAMIFGRSGRCTVGSYRERLSELGVTITNEEIRIVTCDEEKLSIPINC